MARNNRLSMHLWRSLGFMVLILPMLAGCEPDNPLAPADTAAPETQIADPPTIQIDTLNLESHSVWVRASAVPFPVPDEVSMRWEVTATTNNPYWKPKTFKRRGARFFTEGDTARVWGNVPRAYDFEIVVQIAGKGRLMDVDTLRVEAPKCPEGPPGLLCNF